MATWKEIRAEFMDAFGNKCSCCGEQRKEFLTVEHLIGDGADLRAMGQSTYSQLLKLKREGWPRGILDINCYNCNCAKGKTRGICPHDIENGRVLIPYKARAAYKNRLSWGELNDVALEIIKRWERPFETKELYEEICKTYARNKVYGKLMGWITRNKNKKILKRENEKWVYCDETQSIKDLDLPPESSS